MKLFLRRSMVNGGLGIICIEAGPDGDGGGGGAGLEPGSGTVSKTVTVVFELR